MRVSCAQRDAGACTALLSVNVAQTQAIALEFDAHVDATGTGGAELVELDFFAGGATKVYEVDINVEPTGLGVNEYAPALDGGTVEGNSMAPGAFTMGAWTHVRLAVDFDSRTLTIDADKATVIAKALVSTASNGSPRATVGIYTTDLSAWQWEIDDVLVQ